LIGSDEKILCSGSWLASFLLGNLHAKAGNTEMALAAYSGAVRKKTQNPFPFINAGNIYLISAQSSSQSGNPMVKYSFLNFKTLSLLFFENWDLFY
jgi:hypothetical protein